MEYVIIGIVVVIVLAVGVAVFLKSKRNTTGEMLESVGKAGLKSNAQATLEDSKLEEMIVQLEMLPADTVLNEKELVEITDSKVLVHINNLVPGLAQAGNDVQNVARAVQENGEVLYRAVIPKGAELMQSRDMEGALRGMFRGANGIKGHANLVPVEAQKGAEIAANAASAAMGVAAMVVGQYYMSQINAELEEINEGISKISDFLNNEYRSKVFSLVAQVKKISDFQVEILENNELRKSKSSQLDHLEGDCTQLLGQANLTLADYAKKNKLDYEDYEKELQEAQSWYLYQKSLMEVLYKISELRYTLHLGVVSREQCTALLPTYTNQVAETQKRLRKWHQDAAWNLQIDLSKKRRKRDGFDGAVHMLPGIIKDDLRFTKMRENTVKMIEAQSETNHNEHKCDTSNLYAEDVQLVSKGGKVYYLLPDNPDEKAM